jgi:hypothetical protein
MNSSPMADGRALKTALLVAVVLSVALLIAMPILNSNTSPDRAAEAALSDSPSSAPASTKTPTQRQTAPRPIPLSGGRIGGIFSPLARHGVGGRHPDAFFLDGRLFVPTPPAYRWSRRANTGGIDILVLGNPIGSWTGPWELDVSKLRIDHTPMNVVFTLSFAEMNIREGWRNDTFRIYVDSKENPPGPLKWLAIYPAAEREVDFAVVPRFADGEVYRHRGDVPTPIRDCKVDASLHEASDSLTVRAPRRCFEHPDRLRARADMQSRRYNWWEATDSTNWTGLAAPGGSAAIPDPASEWNQEH